MQRLTDNKLSVDLQILYNEASVEYKRSIKTNWNAEYQLVPPHTHRSNASERAIRTFKAHFLSILAVVAPDIARNLWDLLLPQAELTLNLLRQATRCTAEVPIVSHPYFSVCDDVTPKRADGCCVIIK